MAKKEVIQLLIQRQILLEQAIQEAPVQEAVILEGIHHLLLLVVLAQIDACLVAKGTVMEVVEQVVALDAQMVVIKAQQARLVVVLFAHLLAIVAQDVMQPVVEIVVQVVLVAVEVTAQGAV